MKRKKINLNNGKINLFEIENLIFAKEKKEEEEEENIFINEPNLNSEDSIFISESEISLKQETDSNSILAKIKTSVISESENPLKLFDCQELLRLPEYKNAFSNSLSLISRQLKNQNKKKKIERICRSEENKNADKKYQ